MAANITPSPHDLMGSASSSPSIETEIRNALLAVSTSTASLQADFKRMLGGVASNPVEHLPVGAPTRAILYPSTGTHADPISAPVVLPLHHQLFSS